MYYDKFAHVYEVSDDEWRREQEHDIRIVHTGGHAPLVEMGEDAITFLAMLNEQVVKYELRKV